MTFAQQLMLNNQNFGRMDDYLKAYVKINNNYVKQLSKLSKKMMTSQNLSSSCGRLFTHFDSLVQIEVQTKTRDVILLSKSMKEMNECKQFVLDSYKKALSKFESLSEKLVGAHKRENEPKFRQLKQELNLHYNNNRELFSVSIDRQNEYRAGVYTFLTQFFVQSAEQKLSITNQYLNEVAQFTSLKLQEMLVGMNPQLTQRKQETLNNEEALLDDEIENMIFSELHRQQLTQTMSITIHETLQTQTAAPVYSYRVPGKVDELEMPPSFPAQIV